jgi:sugar/nucleoside kinase (ribokinase family)
MSQDSLSSPASRSHDVCCVGTALIDHLAFAGLDVVASLGLDAGTMTLIDGATAARVRAAVGEGADVSGGTVANTATGVASLGGNPVYVGAVADDDLGVRYGEDLEGAGVRAVLERLPAADGGTTGTGACYVIVTPDAERTMATTLGVSGLLHATALDASTVSAASLVYFDGYLLDFPDSEAIVARILELAGSAGTHVALGLADPFVVERHRERLTQLISRVDVIFSNEDEAMNMTGQTTPERALDALRGPDRLGVVTRGARGALLGQGGEVVEVAANAVTEVVDVTGAGDLFAAGVCYGHTHGLDLTKKGQLGALCAAEAIGHLGARPGTSLATLAAAAGII